MDGLWILLRPINPGLDHFKDEKAVLVDETGIDHFAFEIGETLRHQRRCDTLGWRRRQSKLLKFIDVSARAVADFPDFGFGSDSVTQNGRPTMPAP